MFAILRFFVVFWIFFSASTYGRAAQTLTLPAWVCDKPDAIFISGFQTETAVPHNPSQGIGGLASGFQTRTVSISSFGSHNYYIYIPTNYTPSRGWPLLLVLHGAAGSPSGADMAAQALRQDWSGLAETNGFIIVAPVATGSQGGWIAPNSALDSPTDYDVFAAIVVDMESAYNIERSRRYGWGFSAGGYVMYDLMLNRFNASVNADSLVAFSVNSASAIGFACGSDSHCNELFAQASLRHIPVDIHIGLSDPRLPAAKNDRDRFLIYEWQNGQTIFYTEFNGGHTYTGQLASVWPKLCSFALVP